MCVCTVSSRTFHAVLGPSLRYKFSLCPRLFTMICGQTVCSQAVSFRALHGGICLTCVLLGYCTSLEFMCPSSERTQCVHLQGWSKDQDVNRFYSLEDWARGTGWLAERELSYRANRDKVHRSYLPFLLCFFTWFATGLVKPIIYLTLKVEAACPFECTRGRLHGAISQKNIA
jgi:hypothetical protein